MSQVLNLNAEFNVEVPFTEKLKVIPGIFGIRLGEEPEYYVIRSEGEKQVRKYGAQTLVSITLPSESENSETQAFQALSAYIFGKNTRGEHISMTSPVLKEESSGYVTMSFILPQKFMKNAVPQPLDKRILLQHKPAHMVASIAYSGANDEVKDELKSHELQKWLSRFNSYRIISDVRKLQYDGPLTFDFLRKNEVHIGIRCAI